MNFATTEFYAQDKLTCKCMVQIP